MSWRRGKGAGHVGCSHDDVSPPSTPVPDRRMLKLNGQRRRIQCGTGGELWSRRGPYLPKFRRRTHQKRENETRRKTKILFIFGESCPSSPHTPEPALFSEAFDVYISFTSSKAEPRRRKSKHTVRERVVSLKRRNTFRVRDVF